jgi:hypothetical protein
MLETMECTQDVAASLRWEEESAAEREERRARNRDYMRRRRADPQFQKDEKRRRSRERAQACQQSASAGGRGVRQTQRYKCWICGKRPATEVITRLRPSTEVRGGFVQVRVAYCGFC